MLPSSVEAVSAVWPNDTSTGSSTACVNPEGWSALLEAMPHAVWLVDPRELRIIATNAAAARLQGSAGSEMIGRPVGDFAATPEDEAFWRAAAEGSLGSMDSDTLVLRADGSTVPVARRVSRVRSATGDGPWVVALDDRGAQVRRERELELALADLQATFESLREGLFVTDLRGRIRNFNQRFADLWDMPDEVLVPGDDYGVFDWMSRHVVDPARYLRRLATIEGSTMLRASDVLTLRSGRVIERMALPQCSHGQPIGRVYTFRELEPASGELRPGV